MSGSERRAATVEKRERERRRDRARGKRIGESKVEV